jgi:hypothetical protein
VIRKLALTIILLVLATACDAQTVESCMSSDDPMKLRILQEELDREKIPHRVEGNMVCAASEYSGQFQSAILKVFPPDPNKTTKPPLSPSGAPLNSTKLADPSEQRMLETELKKHKIWFTKDETGAIWYEVQWEKEVKQIELRIFGEPKTHFVSDKDTVLFTAALDRQSIKYRVENRNGEKWVIWSRKDNARVQKIKKQVEDQILEQTESEILKTQQGK